MPGPAHVHMVIGGSLPGGEEFSFGYDTLGEAGNQATLDGTVAAVVAWFAATNANTAAMKNLITSGCSYTTVRAYSYAASAATASLVSEATMSVVGNGGGSHPNQVALVATLRTAIPSRRTRGRMYLPGTGIQVAAALQMTTPTPAAVAAAVASLIKSAGVDIQPVVISRVGNLGTPITAVSVDTRLDTQRSRARSQVAVGTATQAVP